MKQQIISSVIENKLIAIVRGVKTSDIPKVIDALYQGGIKFAEITFDKSGRISNEETVKSIAKAVEVSCGKMYIGAGTVTTRQNVIDAYNAGAKYIISPDTNAEVINESVKLGLVSMPGAITPTEIQAAVNNGADFVKLFPISTFGVDYAKAVMSPLSNVKMLAVGGICADNLSKYLKVGFCGAGIGGCLVNYKDVEAGEFEGITDKAKQLVKIANSL